MSKLLLYGADGFAIALNNQRVVEVVVCCDNTAGHNYGLKNSRG